MKIKENARASRAPGSAKAPASWARKTITVDSRYAGALIGYQGTTVKGIEKFAGAKCRISRVPEKDARSKTASFEVVAKNSAAVQRAEMKTNEVISTPTLGLWLRPSGLKEKVSEKEQQEGAKGNADFPALDADSPELNCDRGEMELKGSWKLKLSALN